MANASDGAKNNPRTLNQHLVHANGTLTRIATAADAVAHAVETQAVQAGRGAAAPQLTQRQRRRTVEYSNYSAFLAGGCKLAAVMSES